MRTYVRMAHSRYLRTIARSLRVECGLTVDQLAQRLALPRSTVYYWVRDLPLRRERRRGPAARPNTPRAATGVRQARQVAGETVVRAAPKASRAARDAAYDDALSAYDDLLAQPTFRDFVCVYIARGRTHDAATVELSGSDPAVMRLVKRWLWRLSERSPSLSVAYLPEQTIADVRRYWGEAVDADARTIHVRDMSCGAPSRGAHAPYGALTVTVDDALLSARMQAWMRRTHESWM